MSQYDIEVRDKEGEIRSRFLASGFPRAEYPEVIVYDTTAEWPGAAGSLVMSIPRDLLKLGADAKAQIQVWTFKGGIESLRGIERPRETAAIPTKEGIAPPPMPLCDVADAFGEENAAARINAETLAEGARVVIKGFAAELDFAAPQEPAPVEASPAE